jgi:hypothetical protein
MNKLQKTTSAISVYYRCEFESPSWQSVLDATLCYKVCQRLAADQWFSLGTEPEVSSTNKTDCHDIAEISLKVALNTINQTIKLIICIYKLQISSFFMSFL